MPGPVAGRRYHPNQLFGCQPDAAVLLSDACLSTMNPRLSPLPSHVIRAWRFQGYLAVREVRDAWVVEDCLPASSFVGVAALALPGLRAEIEAVAVV